ncbi:MAG TPA: phosphoglycerate kinase, partial [Methanomassiliicoccales archaeon]|nr:phosphoglycerate kinase [Methanomassiliicoccales archaeon]
MKEFNTLDDFELQGRTVILRVDINCPLRQDNLEIEDDNRIKQIMPTLKELVQKGAKVVIIAHQGRPGDWDFCALDQHASLLTKHLGKQVRYVDDLYGETALNAIRSMRPGECIVLKNVREMAFEQENRSMEEHARSEMIQALSSVADLYVSDAFGAAHRAQCSLIGFQALLPSAAGRLMEKELNALGTVFNNPARPCVFVLGGSKFSDSIKVIDRVLSKNIADSVILVGLSPNAFLKAKGVDLGQDSEEYLMKEFTPENLESAKKLLQERSDRIILPVDVAVDAEGKRLDLSISQLPNDYPILDVGPKSVELFSKIISSAGTVFMSGPAGVFEREEFSTATKALMRAAVESGAFTVIGG